LILFIYRKATDAHSCLRASENGKESSGLATLYIRLAEALVHQCSSSEQRQGK